MADYSELVQAFRWVIEQRVQKKFVFTRGLIGDGQGNVDVTDRPNFSYVRPDRGRADYVEMFNKLANTAVDGTPILIGNIPWQPNLTQVLGVDWEAFMSVGWNASFGGLAAHGQSHAWLDGREPEADYFDIHFRQILPLRTYPLGSGTPSVLVTTWGTEYSGTFVTWPGEPGLSLANAVPPSTGIMREMLVFWDVGLNQLSAMTGTLSYSVTAAPPRPVLATTGSFIPSGYVRLQGGQQSIANTDIFDARQFLSSSSLVSTSTDTTSFWQQAVDTDTLIPVSEEKVRLGLAGQVDPNIADHWLEIITTGTPSQATVHYDTVSLIGNISNIYRAKGTQASPAAVANNDVIFKETYYGYAATGVTWFSVAQMRVEIDGIPIGDDIPGSIVFDAHTPGDAGGSLSERLRIAPTGVIVNAQQEEIDFRVAGSLGDDNVFFVSGLNEVVGIGTGDPDAKFEILATTTQLRLTHTDATKFADFTVNTNHDLTVKPSSTGQVIFQPTTDQTNFFQVLDADGGTPVFNVDVTNERVGVKTATPNNDLQVVGEVTITAAAGIVLSLSGNNNTHIINIDTTISGATSPQTLRFSPSFQPTGAIANFFGINLNPGVGGATGNAITNVLLNQANFKFVDSYSGTVTNLYNFYASNAVDSSSATPVVTNHYGLYVSDLSFASNAWAIYTRGATRSYLGATADGLAAGGKVHVDQSSTSVAIPVMLLDQANIDEPFLKLIGTATAATLNRSIVAEGDVITATRQGFVMVEVQDDGNQITDQDYFMPVYTLA